MAESIMEDMRKLNDLLRKIHAAYHEASQKLGLSDSAIQILYVICNHGESRLLSEIRNLSGTSKQTIHSALRKLEAEGVVRLESLSGRRKKFCLTVRGKDVVNGTVARLIEIEHDVFGSWTQQERNLYLALTQRYLTSFKGKIKEFSGAVLIFPLIWEIDGIWFSIVAAELLAAIVTALFLLGKREKYQYG